MANAKALELMMKLEDDVSAQLKKIREELKGVGDESEKSRKKSEGAGFGFDKLADAVKGFIALAAVQQIAKMGYELVQLGAQAQQLRGVFENLGGSAAGLEQLQAATGGMVDEMTLMQSANKFLMMGLAGTTDEAATLAGMATKLGVAMGQDANTAMADFAAMLANQSIPRLDNFGISSGQVRARIEELTKGVNAMTREAAFMQAVMEIGTQSVQKLGDQSGNTAVKMAGTGSAVRDIKTALGEMINAFLESSGAMDGLLAGLTRLKEFAQAQRDATLAGKELRATLTELSAAGGTTIAAGMQAELKALEGEWWRNRISADEFAAGVAAIQAKANEAASGLRVMTQAASENATEMRGLKAAMSEEVVPAMADLVGSAQQLQDAEMFVPKDQLHAAAETFKETQKEMAEATAEAWDNIGAAAQDGMDTLQSITEGHQSAMEGLAQNFQQQQAQGELQFQMESIQAKLNYEAESLRLAQEGKTAELNNLTANFQAQQANTGQAHSQQQKMAQLNYIQQKIIQQKAYIAELQEAHRKTILSLTETALQYASQGKISAEGLKAILGTLKKGQSQQLQSEVDHAANMSVVSGQLGSNMVADAQATVDGINAAFGKDVAGAAAALASFQTDFDAAKNAILAGLKAEYSAEDFGFDADLGAGLSEGAAQATEPATRALSDVVKQIDDGIKAALSAIKNLVDFDLPAGVDAGLGKMGEFVKLAVTKVYDWLDAPVIAGGTEKVKERLAAIKDSLAPLTDVLNLVNVDLSKLKVVEDLPDLTQWAAQVKSVFDVAFGLAASIRTQYGTAAEEGKDSELQKVAAVIGDITAVLGLAKTEADKMTDFTEMRWPDLNAWGARVFALVQRAVEVLQAVRAQIPELKKAAESTEDVGKVLGIVGVNFESMTKVVDMPWPDLVAWGGRMFAVLKRTVEVLKHVPMLIPDIEDAVLWADEVKTVLGLVGGNFESMNALVDMPWPDLTVWGARLYAAIKRMTEVLETAARNLPGLGIANEVADKVKGVLDVLGVDLEFKMPTMKNYWAQLTLWLSMMGKVAEKARVSLLGMGKEWRTSEMLAATVGKNVKSVLDVLGIDLSFELPNLFDFDNRLAKWMALAKEVAEKTRIMLEGLEDEWRESEMPAAAAAENFGKVMEILDVEFTLTVPTGSAFAPHLQRFLTTVQAVAPMLINFALELKKQFTVIKDGIETDLLGEAAGAVESISGIFDIFDSVASMWEAYKGAPLTAVSGSNFAARVMEGLRNALAGLVPGLKELQTLYLDDLLLIQPFTEAASSQIEALSGFIQSLNGLVGLQVTRSNVATIFATVIGALQSAVQALGNANFTPLPDLAPVIDAVATGGTAASGISQGDGGAALMKFADATTRFDEATTRYESATTILEAAARVMAEAAYAMMNSTGAQSSASIQYSTAGV